MFGTAAGTSSITFYNIPIALGLVFGAVADVAITESLRRMVDAVAQRSYHLLWTAIALGVGVFVVSNGVMLAANYLRAWVDLISGTARQLEMVGHVHRVHYDYVTGQQSGDLIACSVHWLPPDGFTSCSTSRLLPAYRRPSRRSLRALGTSAYPISSASSLTG